MKTILVGVDASERAKGVLAAAADLAGKMGAQLILIRAIGLPAELPVEAYRLSAGSLSQLLQEEAEKSMQAMAQTVAGSLVASTRVALGAAWQVICEAAVELDVDLIVIGSHGFGVLDRVLGTTAARIVNHADRSVLVARPRP